MLHQWIPKLSVFLVGLASGVPRQEMEAVMRVRGRQERNRAVEGHRVVS